MVRSRLPAMASAPTAGRLEEKIVLSNGFTQVVPAVQIVNGMFADTGDVSANDPNDVKGAVAVPLISANTGVDAVRPLTPRVKSIASPVQVVGELQVIVPETLANEPVKPTVKPVIVNGDDGAATAVNDRIDAAEAVIVPNRMHARSATAFVNLLPLFITTPTFLL